MYYCETHGHTADALEDGCIYCKHMEISTDLAAARKENERLEIDIARMRAGCAEADKFEQTLMDENVRLRDALMFLDTAIMPEERKYDQYLLCEIHKDTLRHWANRVNEALKSPAPTIGG